MLRLQNRTGSGAGVGVAGRGRVQPAWLAAGLVATLVATACTPSVSGEGARRTSYGESVRIGNGTARTYVVTEGGRPVEIGVALGEKALERLPSHHDAGGVHVHGHTTFEYVLSLPAEKDVKYRHVLVNWNPGGHEPPGIYDLEHFDFHFYTMTSEERLTIDEADPDFQRKAEREPAPEYVPEGYILPAPLAFARMGVHWVDPKSPELNGETFTNTFIFGSWDGRVIFAEPMITKKFLESKQDFSAKVPLPAKCAEPGLQPSGYSVRWDEASREYRIALTDLVPCS